VDNCCTFEDDVAYYVDLLGFLNVLAYRLQI
jgi:hypothetical protein